MTSQGDLALLEDPVALELLNSTIRVAYNWLDGTPRVVPIWFHWDGMEFVLGSRPRTPKLKALRVNPKVALAIDDNKWPHKVLLVRGTAAVQMVAGVPSEYALAAKRYFGDKQGEAWVERLRGTVTEMGRIAIWPEWLGILDFETRFPSALS